MTAAERLIAHLNARREDPIRPGVLYHLFPQGEPSWALQHKVYLTYGQNQQAKDVAAFGRHTVLITASDAGLLLFEDDATIRVEDGDDAVNAFLLYLLAVAKDTREDDE